ncbi:hypothetical protein GJ496_000391 [Pomphorhynchus laevis]|nr:hypothetical protein GJ496_000391 [Pomphorhynchus laevis]
MSTVSNDSLSLVGGTESDTSRVRASIRKSRDIGIPRNQPILNFIKKYASESTACKYGCNGSMCKFEMAEYWPTNCKAIPNLYSHWINNRILAMARPTNDNV